VFALLQMEFIITDQCVPSARFMAIVAWREIRRTRTLCQSEQSHCHNTCIIVHKTSIKTTHNYGRTIS